MDIAMNKITLGTALALAVFGVSALASTPSMAAGCLNPFSGFVDLTHNAMKDGAGFGYDKRYVDRQLAKGNRCDATEQSLDASTLYDTVHRPIIDRQKDGHGNYN